MPRVSAAYVEDRRRQILDAALRCFAREGFHRTTMRHVVRETGLSAGAIYQYFDSKDELIAAIAAQRRAAELELVRGALATGDMAAGLKRLMQAAVGRLSSAEERRWRRVTVQLWGEALRSQRVRRLVDEGLDAPLRVLAAAMRRAQRQGRMTANVKPEAAARVAVAVFQGLVLQQAWDPSLDVAAYSRAAEHLLAALGGTRRSSR